MFSCHEPPAQAATGAALRALEVMRSGADARHDTSGDGKVTQSTNLRTWAQVCGSSSRRWELRALVAVALDGAEAGADFAEVVSAVSEHAKGTADEALVPPLECLDEGPHLVVGGAELIDQPLPLGIVDRADVPRTLPVRPADILTAPEAVHQVDRKSVA